MAKVVAVNVSEKKGTIKHAVEEVEMKEDFGIVGILTPNKAVSDR